VRPGAVAERAPRAVRALRPTGPLGHERRRRCARRARRDRLRRLLAPGLTPDRLPRRADADDRHRQPRRGWPPAPPAAERHSADLVTGREQRALRPCRGALRPARGRRQSNRPRCRGRGVVSRRTLDRADEGVRGADRRDPAGRNGSPAAHRCPPRSVRPGSRMVAPRSLRRVRRSRRDSRRRGSDRAAADARAASRRVGARLVTERPGARLRSVQAGRDPSAHPGRRGPHRLPRP